MKTETGRQRQIGRLTQNLRRMATSFDEPRPVLIASAKSEHAERFEPTKVVGVL